MKIFGAESVIQDGTPVLYGLLHKAFVKRATIKITVEDVEFRCVLWKLGGSSYSPNRQLIDFTVQATGRPKNIKPAKKGKKA